MSATYAASVADTDPDRQSSVLSLSRHGFHRIAYTDWGDIGSERVVVCVHGLTRQGRDFDRLAAALARQGCRVICPDLAGRGRSDRLRDPEEYALPQYALDMTVLLSRLGVPSVEWVGTSLGGLIGIVMAGQLNSPIRKLVINDIGPVLPWSALNRLGENIRRMPRSFPHFPAAEAFYRDTLAPFGNLADDEWQHLTQHSVERTDDGQYRVLCDPEIARAFRPGLFYALSLWSYWDAITCPTLVMRGETSDLLLLETVHEMARRGPGAEAVEIADVGHAPALLNEEQIRLVCRWLTKRHE